MSTNRNITAAGVSFSTVTVLEALTLRNYVD